jgi:exonuclease VII small subunit
MIVEKILKLATSGAEGVLSPEETEEMVKSIKAFEFQNAVSTLNKAVKLAEKAGKKSCQENLQDARGRLLQLSCDEARPANVQSQGE